MTFHVTMRGDDVVLCTVFKTLGDMWMYDIPTSNWSDISGSISGDIPSARMCAMDVVGGLVYLFGGWFTNGDTAGEEARRALSQEYDDFFVFDPASLQWRDITGVESGTPPQGSQYGTAAGANGHLFVYSGISLRLGGEGVSCELPVCEHRRRNLARLDWLPDILRCKGH
jgi:hypothetical protein